MHQDQDKQPAASGTGNADQGDQPCGFWRLLMILLYDAVVLVALWMLAALIALALHTGQRIAGHDPLYTAYLVLVWWLYIGACWHKGGMTLGMRAWKVEIVGSDGGRPSWGRCLLRWLTGLVSLLALGLGYFWMLFHPEKKSWHDLASGTRLRRRL